MVFPVPSAGGCLHATAANPARSSRHDHVLVAILEVMNHFHGVKVEDCLADRQPLTTLKKENRRGVPQITQRRQSFDVTSFDRFELNRDGDQHDQLAALPFAGQLHASFEGTIFPAQTTGLAGHGNILLTESAWRATANYFR
jgi:hypothetical protein